MLNPFFQAISVYNELLKTGSVQSIERGEKISFVIKANITGDIMEFFYPTNKNTPFEEILKQVRSNHESEQLRLKAQKLIGSKLLALTLLPKSLVWIIYIILSYIYFDWQLENFINKINEKVSILETWQMLPWLLVTVVTLYYGKPIGFLLLKPMFILIIKITKLGRLVFKRQIK